jgi:hypothetical protein
MGEILPLHLGEGKSRVARCALRDSANDFVALRL